MQNNGDKRATRRANEERDDSRGTRAAWCGRVLKAVIALIAVAAAVACVPALARADFPLAGLLIFCIGMGFIAMPLCLYYEVLLKRDTQGADTASA